MVRLDRITRRFGPRVLFEGLSWQIGPDARIGLVGPNGAGKTTLLRLIAGADSADAGHVRVPESLQVGYLPQEVETLGEGAVLDIVLDGLGELREIERRLADLEARMGAMAEQDADLDRIAESYGALRARYEALGGDRTETRARRILSGLGVPSPAFTRPLAELSGGWRMRVALAKLLVGSPGLLLLDEPTNHLDLEALSWLESFLADYPGAFVVVSHDRYFLNRMVRGIAELDRGRLDSFTGHYDDYLRAKAERDELLAQRARLEAKEIARVERFIERFRYKASKARQVQSRIRSLEKRERLDGPRSDAKRIGFGFPEARRSGEIVVRAEKLAKSWGGTEVYRELDLIVRRGDRIALVGPNGAGKSTLLKLFAGVVPPTAGSVVLGHNVTVEYYAQHQLEALDPRATVLESVEDVGSGLDRPRLRTLLGSFLFRGEEVDKPVEVISGGEKARLALCRMLLRPANVLLLDEPTNHLDLAGREVLEGALNEFAGTLMFVSHDRYFMNRVATSVAEVGGGSVTIRPGDYDSWVERSRPDGAPERDDTPDVEPRRSRRDLKRAEAEQRNRLYRERKERGDRSAHLESQISALESELVEIGERQADPRCYRDPEIAARLGRRKSEIEEQLEGLYRRWETLIE